MNVPLSVNDLISGGQGIKSSGGWMAALLGKMINITDIQFACAAFGKVNRIEVARSKRCDSYFVPEHGAACSLKLCRDLVNDWQPDLIHIHGTENAYGLLTARGMICTPTVISLQGLLGPSSEWYHYFGNRSLLDVLRMHRFLEFPALRGHWMGFMQIRRSAKREEEIIQGNRFFIGRTAWDKAYIQALNPKAIYLNGGELLREPFWKMMWSLKHVRRYRIIFTNAGHPRKGTETLLDAVSLLLPDYPNIQIAIAGSISRRSGYGRYIRSRIATLNGAAVELGQLDSDQMVRELACSHVFVSPSFIDNSPNAVCEAQLIGMPLISSYTGGVPSLIEDGRTGLFYPTGDAPMLASRIREIFENDELACRLGSQAREVALARHDPDTVVNQILSAYRSVLDIHSSAMSQTTVSV
jgi:glycosyltransferase involved in cell wall biosynthesis